MRFLRCVLLAVVMCALIAGCGGDKERGVNSGRDRPKAADKAE
jgi:hypothetical protein